MGSLEEEKLLQMVHDFIESSDSKASSHNFNNSPPTQKNVIHSTRYFTLQEILMKKTEDEKEILEKVGKYMRNKMDVEKTTRVKQWLVKCLKLEDVHASLCHTSWVTSPSCPCGSYEYIEIVKEDHDAKGCTQRLIVDIDFKSQFEVARPTQSYTQLLSKLPIIFIGSEAKLNKIISLLCSAAEESLKEKGLHVPPWRRATYMQSKWKLTNSKNNYTNYPSNISKNNYNNGVYLKKNNNDVNVKYGSRLETWGPKNVMMKGRRRELGGGLTNQFSNMSINCC